MANDPIIDAAERYIDLILTTPVDKKARAALVRFMTRRSDRSPNVELARQNAVRFVQEAAKEALGRGARTVDVAAVDAAWMRLCPGLYPFC